MSGFESRLEDDKTTKRRQKSFQSVPVNDYKPEKIHNFLILKEARKAENSKILMGLMVDRHFRHEIYLNFRAKIKLKFRTKSSKFVRCKKIRFFFLIFQLCII